MIASDGFIPPQTFAEFQRQYPNYLRRYAYHHAPEMDKAEQETYVRRLEAALLRPLEGYVDRIAVAASVDTPHPFFISINLSICNA